jgi:hypothetical protein
MITEKRHSEVDQLELSIIKVELIAILRCLGFLFIRKPL